MAKRSFTTAFKELPPEEEVGYISKVSDPLTSKKMNRYFQGEIQTKSTTYVNFNIEKHQEFVKAERLNSPVKICNYKLSPNNSGNLEILLNKQSRLEYIKNAPFKRKLEFTDCPSTSSSSASIQKEAEHTKIADIDVSKTHQKYSILAKVVSEEDEEKVLVYGTMKIKKDFKVADESASITITLFEDQIKKIVPGMSYVFKNMSSRNYDGLKLTSTQTTTIQVTNDLESVCEISVEQDQTTLKGTIEQVQCTKKYKCAVCEKQVKIEDPNATKVKCTNCNLKSNVRSLKESLTCRLNIKDENQKKNMLW